MIATDDTSTNPTTEWEDRQWEVTVTIPTQITGPLIIEFHGLTHQLATGTIVPGTYTYTFTFRQFSGTIANIPNLNDDTYGTDPSNLRLRTASYSEVHYAHFGSGSVHPTADHYVVGGRVNDMDQLELDIKGLGQNAVTIDGVGGGSDFTPVSFTDNAPRTLTLDFTGTTRASDVNGIGITSTENLDNLLGATFEIDDGLNTPTTHTVTATADQGSNIWTISFQPNYNGVGLDGTTTPIPLTFTRGVSFIALGGAYGNSTLATDIPTTLATKDYVDAVASGGDPFVSQQIGSAPFNFAYTLDQYNAVTGRNLQPINANPIEFQFTLTPTLMRDQMDFSTNGGITNALNSYLDTDTSSQYYDANLTTQERADIVTALDNSDTDGGGALIEMIINTGTDQEQTVPFFVFRRQSDSVWFWRHGGIPEQVTLPTVTLRINHFAEPIQTFNDVDRLPFAIIAQEVDGVTMTELEIEALISDAIARGEVRGIGVVVPSSPTPL